MGSPKWQRAKNRCLVFFIISHFNFYFKKFKLSLKIWYHFQVAMVCPVLSLRALHSAKWPSLRLLSTKSGENFQNFGVFALQLEEIVKFILNAIFKCVTHVVLKHLLLLFAHESLFFALRQTCKCIFLNEKQHML